MPSSPSRYYAAEMALTLDYPLKPKSLEGITTEFGEIACFALQLLARICSKSERQELAAKSHRNALKLNPFLWHSFTDLCHLRQNDEPPVDPEQIFQFTNETFQTCQSQSSYLGVREATAAGFSLDVQVAVNSVTCAIPHNPQQQGPQNVSLLYSPSTLTTPVDQIIQPNVNLQLRAIPFDAATPLTNNHSASHFLTPAAAHQQQQLMSNSNTKNLRQSKLSATATTLAAGGGGSSSVVALPNNNRKQIRFMSNSNFSPMTPSFGVMPLVATPLSVNHQNHSSLILHTPQPQQQQQQQQPQTPYDQNEQPVVVAKKIRSHNTNSSIKRKDSPMPESKFLINQFNNHNSNTTNNTMNVRRSSRLFSSNNYSVKENKQAMGAVEQQNNLLNNSNAKVPKSPMRKSKQRLTSVTGKLNSTAAAIKSQNLNSSLGELNEKATNKVPLIEDAAAEEQQQQQQQQAKIGQPPPPVVDAQQVLQHVLNLKRESVDGLMILLRQIGKAYSALDRFSCQEALHLFRKLPPQHLTSSWVQSQLAVAHHEMHEYEAAARLFQEIHKREPHRVEFMEIYSTALWHLQREVELSALAHDLMAQNKNSPVTWCVTGNCFSLHKEHDVAIKFFQRAVQVDGEFVYSYILLGHEFVITEELEKAMSCFRTAIQKESRHYNAWFGIGTIYSKQEKFQQAELYYARALRINPRNSVLLVHIGAMQLFSKQMDQALATLNAAIRLDPKNPLGKFHRSRLYFATKRYEEALAELEELKEIVPKESVIYYLIGKIHTKMGNSDLGLMHFSWASDLDPKGANNQIKESFDSAVAAAGGSNGSSAGADGGAGSGVGGGVGGGGLGDSSSGNNNNNSNSNDNVNNSSHLLHDDDDEDDGDSEALDEDVTGDGVGIGGVEDEEEEEEELLADEDEREMNLSFQTPTTRSNPGGGGGAAVVAAPARPTAAAAMNATATTTSGGGGGVESTAEGNGNAMDTTPRTWNVLNYDSDSF